MTTLRQNKPKPNTTFAYVKRHYMLYLMLIPGLAYIVIFKLLPYWGIQIAFRDYNIFSGSNPLAAISTSKWVGTKYFDKLFNCCSALSMRRKTAEIVKFKGTHPSWKKTENTSISMRGFHKAPSLQA